MSIFNFFKKKKKASRKINIETDTLLFLKEDESSTEINGETFKKIQFRVVESIDYDVSKSIKYLEEIIKDKQRKINTLLVILENEREKNIAQHNLYVNTFHEFSIKQKLKKTDIQETRQLNIVIDGANKTIARLNKFQVENNILKQQILEQDKIIKEYQQSMLDDSYELKQAEDLIKALKNKLGNK